MDKTFTLSDLQFYLREISKIDQQVHDEKRIPVGPSKSVLQNLLSYSRAMDVLKTATAGTFFSLAN
jgi:hypothetical protein